MSVARTYDVRSSAAGIRRRSRALTWGRAITECCTANASRSARSTVIAAAAFVLILIPGPNMLFIVAQSLAGGRRNGVAAAFGLLTGTLIYIAAAAVGVFLNYALGFGMAVLVISVALIAVVRRRAA